MPAKEVRKAFEEAIEHKDSAKIREFLQWDSAKKLLLLKDDQGSLPIHDACCYALDSASLQLILDTAVHHGIAKKMLEEVAKFGMTCLHFACLQDLTTDSFQFLLEYLSKYADIKKMLEEKNNDDWTCLHLVCMKNSSTDSLRLLLEYLSDYADISTMLEEKDILGLTWLHYACRNEELSTDSLRLLLEYLPEDGSAKKVLEEKDCGGHTCLHEACSTKLFIYPFCLLLEYLSKHADIKKMLEAQDDGGLTCLHCACAFEISTASLRLLISFFPSNESLQLVLSSKDCFQKTPVDCAKTEEHKQLLQDPDCWRKCRYWLFCNHQETFLNSLYPNSPEKTLEALQELGNNYADDDILKQKTLLLQNLVARLRIIPDESAARQALELEALTTIDVGFNEDFHRDHIVQLETTEIRQLIADFQRQKPLSEEELNRQELEKIIFDRLSRDRCITQVIPILHENDVTKENFFLLKESDFREMNIKIGPMRQLLQIIEQETLRRNNLSARSDISSRPRSPGQTSRSGGIPPNAPSALPPQRHQEPQQRQDVSIVQDAPPLPPGPTTRSLRWTLEVDSERWN